MEKKPQNKSKKSSPEKTQNSVEHYNAVLIEGLRSEFKFVAEMVGSLADRFDTKLNDFTQEMRSEIGDIKTILTKHSGMLQQNEARWEQNDKRWEQNDKRLDNIENKLDHVILKVIDHDHEITLIKEKQLQ